MTADLSDCVFSGPALPAAYVSNGLRLDDSAHIQAAWDRLRPSLLAGSRTRRPMGVMKALAPALDYRRPVDQPAVPTRQGPEAGGLMLFGASGAKLRAWVAGGDAALDAPGGDRGRPDSLTRIAQRVLDATGEPAGLITDGETLRLLIHDPSRADSHVTIDLASWRRQGHAPDSFRLLRHLAAADRISDLSRVLDEARLHQARITKDLRRQARDAIVDFINALPDRLGIPAQVLWQQALILVYRLLFIFKLEAGGEIGFSFASTSVWQDILSPNRVLAPLVRRHLDHGHQTGTLLESGLRQVFGLFRDGFACSELCITPLGGGLFGAGSLQALDRCTWGDHAVALLLDRLIWTTTPAGARARVHYGSLGTEELGAVYESLLEQEPAIASAPLLRTGKPKAERIEPAWNVAPDIPRGAFFLRAGPGRKASGSYYTPQAFVRFIVRRTLAPKVEALCPRADPHPRRLLTLRIVDPGMGSGHFLVEACRFLAEALLSACVGADERGLHDRIAALPDPDNSLSAYLPSRGWAEAKARAICRRLVAVHCLYGCDRNPLAVELAKLSLWLESYAEGLPLTFLDHRLVHGDALTAPFFEDLKTLPVTRGPLDPLLAAAVARRLDAIMTEVRHLTCALDATLGSTVPEIACKEAIKRRLDGLLDPLRHLARAWAGAAMLRRKDADDVWLQLAAHVADGGAWPARLTEAQQALFDAAADALPWDLSFPEAEQGFAAVIGNPPWDVLLPNTKDFLSGLEPGSADDLSQPEVAVAFADYRARFTHMKRLVARLYRHQRAGQGSDATGGSLDLFRLFAERAFVLAAPDGSLGLLLPSAFHANEGATGLRRLYLRNTSIDCCLSFENRRRLFEIDSRFKFDIIIAHRPGPSRSLQCGFYLQRIEDAADTFTYGLNFLEASGGPTLTPLELRNERDVRVAQAMFASTGRLGAWCAERGIGLGSELHMTGDAALFQPAGAAPLVLHEGKSFHQYTNRWHAAPRYSVKPETVRPPILRAASHYRLAFRDIARATDERTMIACIAPPGSVFGHTASVERSPWTRRIADALTLCAVFNSFSFDWLVRQKASTHLSLYLLAPLPMPALCDAAAARLAAAAAKLTCVHAEYDALRSDLGIAEAMGDPAQLRAEADALVARCYGLSRGLYEQVLSGFNHRLWPEAPALCLQAFDSQAAARSGAVAPAPV